MEPILAAALALGTQQTAPAAQTWEVHASQKVKMHFVVSLPEGYEQDRTKRWPVMLFLHGAGERGTDLKAVSIHGPLKEIAKGRKLPFIVIAPQLPPDEVWEPNALIALMDATERKYRIDKEREYVSGLSMGGYGTWALVAAQPDRFAAAAPICGGGGANWIAPKRLASTPIWATHGDADGVVPITEDQKIVDAVRQAGGDVKFDVIAGWGHDVWTDVYAEQAIYDWFLAHQRKR